jgi:hypothetical protein
VKGFSQLCAPLTDLTKKGAFKWNEEAQMTMDKMKKVIEYVPRPSSSRFRPTFHLGV